MNRLLAIILVFSVFPTLAYQESDDCDDALSTIEINQCALSELDLAQKELKKYLEASYEQNSHDPMLVEAIKSAQKDWQTYSKSHCGAIYTQWRDGSIRGVMAISCRIKLTKYRTHEIWENFLNHVDSTPPVLPEPQK